MANDPRQRAAKTKTQSRDANAISPSFLVEVATRWWPVCLPVCLVLVAISCAIVWYVFEPDYESRAVIRIVANPAYVMNQDDDQKHEDFVKNELAVMRSPLVLGHLLGNKEIMAVPELKEAIDPERKLAEMINVRSAGGSELHFVTCRAKNPKHAQLINKELVDAYFFVRKNYSTQSDEKLMTALDRVIADQQKKVGDLESRIREELRKAETEPGTVVDPNGRLVVTPLQSLQAIHEQTIINMEVVEQQINDLKKQIQNEPVTVTDDDVELAIEDDPYVKDLRLTIASQKSEYQVKRAFGADHPESRRLMDAIRSNEQLLSKARVELWDVTKSRLIQLKEHQRERDLESFERQMLQHSAEFKILGEKIKEHSDNLKTTSGHLVSTKFLEEDLAAARDIRERLAYRLLAIKSEREAPQRVIQIEDSFGDASLPTVPVETIPYKGFALFGGIAFIFPIALALLWEMRVRRVSSSEQLEEQASVELIGEVSVLPARNSRRSGSQSRRMTRQLKMFEESVDSMRTCFLLSDDFKDHQVIAVTSAVANEGKTTVASQLAISIARATGKRVLLVDGDFRSPDVHFIFDANNSPGLAEVLVGDMSVAEVVQGGWEENLDVLAAGESRSFSPHQLVGNGTLQKFFDDVREVYDFTIVDTSPVLSSSESMFFARRADVVLMSVMRNTSRLAQVTKLAERLTSSGANVAGFVLNGVPHRKYAYTYGTYYGNLDDAS